MTLPKARFVGYLGVLSFCTLPLPAFAQVVPASAPQKTVATSVAPPVPPPAAVVPADDKAVWESDDIVNADLLKMEVVVSRTAQVFHIVDQLSRWSKNCHKQYLSYFGGSDGSELSDDDQAMLQKHVSVREKHDWGQGLEQTFYAPLSIKEAAQEGVTGGLLTAEEAATEVEVLEYFAPKVELLIQKELPTLTKFRDQLKTERVPIALFTRQLSRLCGNRRYKAAVYLIVNPHDVSFGSAVAGGRMIVEIPRYGDAYTTLVRNLLSVFVEQYQDDINKSVTGVEGLDADTLTDAIGEAMVPGLLRPEGADDVLLNRVAHDLETKKSLTEPGVRTQRFALMIRPALAAALADKSQTMSAFLPHAVDIWRSMNELQRAATTSVSQYRVSNAPSIFVFGNLDATLVDYFHAGSRNLFSRPHQTAAYEELLGKYSKPNDTVILLATSDTVSHIPTPFTDLLPLPMSTLLERLGRGETVVMQGTARQLKVVLLAAPKQVILESLVRTNRALWQ